MDVYLWHYSAESSEGPSRGGQWSIPFNVVCYVCVAHNIALNASVKSSSNSVGHCLCVFVCVCVQPLQMV